MQWPGAAYTYTWDGVSTLHLLATVIIGGRAQAAAGGQNIAGPARADFTKGNLQLYDGGVVR